MSRSYVVTGGGRRVGRAVVERLLAAGDRVVAIELDPAALAWAADHPAGARLVAVIGDAADEAVTERAADRAEADAELAGWVNNAATFRDAALHRLHPIGRVGRVEEAADVVAYLLSGEASFVNGAVVPVDGGRAALGRDPEEA